MERIAYTRVPILSYRRSAQVSRVLKNHFNATFDLLPIRRAAALLDTDLRPVAARWSGKSRGPVVALTSYPANAGPRTARPMSFSRWHASSRSLISGAQRKSHFASDVGQVCREQTWADGGCPKGAPHGWRRVSKSMDGLFQQPVSTLSAATHREIQAYGQHR